MSLSQEPLLHAIIEAAHDPDPDRAFRFHPFAFRVAAGLPRAGRAPSGNTNRPARAAIGRFDALAIPRSVIPHRQSAAGPCCAPACC